MTVTPASGKGTLDLGGSIVNVAFGHSAELSLTYERGLGPGQTAEVGAYANQRLNLAKRVRPKEERPRFRTGPGKAGCPGL